MGAADQASDHFSEEQLKEGLDTLEMEEIDQMAPTLAKIERFELSSAPFLKGASMLERLRSLSPIKSLK